MVSMKTMKNLLWVCHGLLAFALTHANAATPLQIQGATFQPQEAKVALPAVDRQQVLRFRLDQPVTISGWPASLPRKLGQQNISLMSLPNPAGPITFARFTRAGVPTPWLVLVSRGRSGSEIIAPWRLKIEPAGRYSLNAGDGSIRLIHLAQPVILKDAQGVRWQFELLSVSAPANSGQDQEARGDWYLRQLSE